jgi:hypothetical protein
LNPISACLISLPKRKDNTRKQENRWKTGVNALPQNHGQQSPIAGTASGQLRDAHHGGGNHLHPHPPPKPTKIALAAFRIFPKAFWQKSPHLEYSQGHLGKKTGVGNIPNASQESCGALGIFPTAFWQLK